MRSELKEIVEDYRKVGLPLRDEEVENIEKFCYRKMEVAKVENQDEYLPLLFKDMVKEHFIRMAINAKTLLGMIERKVENDVHGMRTISLPPKMSKCAGTDTDI